MVSNLNVNVKSYYYLDHGDCHMMFVCLFVCLLFFFLGVCIYLDFSSTRKF